LTVTVDALAGDRVTVSVSVAVPVAGAMMPVSTTLSWSYAPTVMKTYDVLRMNVAPALGLFKLKAKYLVLARLLAVTVTGTVTCAVLAGTVTVPEVVV
jgi:hypothetical protein